MHLPKCFVPKFIEFSYRLINRITKQKEDLSETGLV